MWGLPIRSEHDIVQRKKYADLISDSPSCAVVYNYSSHDDMTELEQYISKAFMPEWNPSSISDDP